MKSGIYCIENKSNGKKYIGSAKNIKKRWYTHKYTLNKKCHDNSHLQNAWNKYGSNNFELKIIKLVSPIDLIKEEQYYIDYYDVINRDNGYNIAPTAGNTLGYKHTDETKERLSLLKKNKPSVRGTYVMSEETKSKISKANKISQIGKKHSEETKKKMSENRKGVILSEETKKKMSENRKGVILSEETKSKISKALIGNKFALGHKHTNETKEKMRNKIITNETKEKQSKSMQGKNRGENNGMTITNKNEVISIRTDYDNGLSISNLTIKYNKNYMFIYKIVKRLRWAWLDDSGIGN